MKTYDQMADNVNFTAFMSLPNGCEELRLLLDSFSDYGLSCAMDSEELLLGSDDEVRFNLENLADHMRWFAEWTDGKLRAFDQLQANSFHSLREASDLHEVLSVSRGGQQFEGEWCRSDGVIFVRHHGTVDAAPAQTRGRKRDRAKWDRLVAENMLMGLVESASCQPAMA